MTPISALVLLSKCLKMFETSEPKSDWSYTFRALTLKGILHAIVLSAAQLVEHGAENFSGNTD